MTNDSIPAEAVEAAARAWQAEIMKAPWKPLTPEQIIDIVLTAASHIAVPVHLRPESTPDQALCGVAIASGSDTSRAVTQRQGVCADCVDHLVRTGANLRAGVEALRDEWRAEAARVLRAQGISLVAATLTADADALNALLREAE